MFCTLPYACTSHILCFKENSFQYCQPLVPVSNCTPWTTSNLLSSTDCFALYSICYALQSKGKMNSIKTHNLEPPLLPV